VKGSKKSKVKVTVITNVGKKRRTGNFKIKQCCAETRTATVGTGTQKKNRKTSKEAGGVGIKRKKWGKELRKARLCKK